MDDNNYYETQDGSRIYRVRVFGNYVNLETEDGMRNLSLWDDRIVGGMSLVKLEDIQEVINAGDDKWIELRRNS